MKEGRRREKGLSSIIAQRLRESLSLRLTGDGWLVGWGKTSGRCIISGGTDQQAEQTVAALLFSISRRQKGHFAKNVHITPSIFYMCVDPLDTQTASRMPH